VLLALFSYVGDFPVCVTGPVSRRHSSSKSDSPQWPLYSFRLVLLEIMMFVGIRRNTDRYRLERKPPGMIKFYK